MRRRRQQILERKLQQFRSKDGGPDTGGTLKIYGESLCRDVPYKTLLLSIRDTAQQVVREMLMKYGLDKEDPHNYCLVQVSLSHRLLKYEYTSHEKGELVRALDDFLRSFFFLHETSRREIQSGRNCILSTSMKMDCCLV